VCFGSIDATCLPGARLCSLVVGQKEAETHSVSIRRLGGEGQTVLPLADALAALVEEVTPPVIGRARHGT
jgi:hypothetical protein